MVGGGLVAKSCLTLATSPWTVACQAPLSMGFSRQEYWSGSPFPSPGDLPDPGIELTSSALQADTLSAEPTGKIASVESQHLYLSKAMAPHANTLAWKISWMEEPGRLQSMGSLRVGHD